MFGWRKNDEDPFAALKDGGAYQSAPTTIPDIGVGLGADSKAAQAAAGAPSASPMPSHMPSSMPTAAPAPATTIRAPQTTPGLGSSFTYGTGRMTRRSGLGVAVVLRLAVAAIVIVAVGIPLLSIGNSVHSISVPSFNFGSTTPSPGTASPGAVRHISYLSPSGVRAGIAHLERVVPGARVVLFRIDAKSLSATAVGRHGGAKQVYFSSGVTSVTSAPAPGQQPVPISQVSPGVVGRLVAEMGRRFHVPARRIDYMVISSPPGLPAQWIVFSTAPSHPGFAATLSGAGLHRL